MYLQSWPRIQLNSDQIYVGRYVGQINFVKSLTWTKTFLQIFVNWIRASCLVMFRVYQMNHTPASLSIKSVSFLIFNVLCYWQYVKSSRYAMAYFDDSQGCLLLSYLYFPYSKWGVKCTTRQEYASKKDSRYILLRFIAILHTNGTIQFICIYMTIYM